MKLAASLRLPRVDLAAILAHDEPVTCARAARVYRVPLEVVEVMACGGGVA